MTRPSFLQITPHGGVLLTVPYDPEDRMDDARAQLREGKRVLIALNRAVGNASFGCLTIFNPDEDQ